MISDIFFSLKYKKETNMPASESSLFCGNSLARERIMEKEEQVTLSLFVTVFTRTPEELFFLTRTIKKLETPGTHVLETLKNNSNF